MYNDIDDLKNYIENLEVKIAGYRYMIKKSQNEIAAWQKELDNANTELNNCMKELKQKVQQ